MHILNTKFEYLVKKIENIKKPNILELGVHRGGSTKTFLNLCDKNNGHLISVDIVDCSKVSDNPNWKFIHSSDDNFELINKQIREPLDVLYIDSLHEASHVKKVFYNYYKFLKIGGLCFVDDISWLPYIKKKKTLIWKKQILEFLTKFLRFMTAIQKIFFLNFFLKDLVTQ